MQIDGHKVQLGDSLECTLLKGDPCLQLRLQAGAGLSVLGDKLRMSQHHLLPGYLPVLTQLGAGREGGRKEGGREGGKEGGREGGTEGGRERGIEGGREVYTQTVIWKRMRYLKNALSKECELWRKIVLPLIKSTGF